MPFADDIAGAGNGRFLHQGLLGTCAQWPLPLGASQVPSIRRAARALLLLATGLLLAWACALFSQARSGQGSWLLAMIAVAIALPWLMMSWGSWQSLGIEQVVTLCWGGLPPFRPAIPSAEVPPGWSVTGAGQAGQQAVAVHVVFDLGVWVLVKMVPTGNAAIGTSWSWLDTRTCFKGTAGHHLRALLFNARANQVRAEQVVASSTNHQRQWSNLLSSFKTNDQFVGSRGAVPDSEFANTLILADSEQAVPRRIAS